MKTKLVNDQYKWILVESIQLTKTKLIMIALYLIVGVVGGYIF